MNTIELKIKSDIENALRILDPNNSLPSFHPTIEGTLQQIFYGAPGTGKSFKIKEMTRAYPAVRTTFHPDSDYSTFVGAYKPTMDSIEQKVIPVVVNNGINLDQNNGTYRENRISYTFVKQAFMKAYLSAWKKMTEETVTAQFLIIEEINRGNCAQIFGDLFQLLDRQENGFSEYPIEADTDLQKEIERAFKEDKDYKLDNAINVEGAVKDYTSNFDATLSEDIQHGRVLLLPGNLYIWATMNTSDQSLFPIDSAFKRRWDWQYVPICQGRDSTGKVLKWKIQVDNKQFDWWTFLQRINEKIYGISQSEDKKLGFFFLKPKDGIINSDVFVSKVIFYLWNDVFKDYFTELDFLNDKEGKALTFDSFYDVDNRGKAVVYEAAVLTLLDNLGLEPVSEEEEDEETEETTADTTNTTTDTATTKKNYHKKLNYVIFPDGTEFRTEDLDNSPFETYYRSLKKIGLQQVADVAEKSEYKRRECPFISRTQYDAVVNYQFYSYVSEDGVHVIKGIDTDGMVNMLNELNKKLDLNIEIG